MRYAPLMRGIPSLAILLAGALMFSAPGLVSAASAADRPVLVELFTSQGCSSCPPADHFMQELTSTPGIVALTLNVDIWDYLGWKDSFAKHQFSLRQQAYAPTLPSRSVFTPQMVIGGKTDVVGSRRDEALARIKEVAADEGPAVAVGLTLDGDKAIVTLPETRELSGATATIWVARVLSSREVNVGDGENRGKVIVYSNIVRDLSAAGVWRGEAVSLDLPARLDTGETYDRLAVFVQRGETGMILGATIIDVPLAGTGTP